MEAGEGTGQGLGAEAVAAHESGALLLLGTAGTGRTEALVRRAAALTERGIDPRTLLVITRGRANAALLRLRIERALGHAHDEVWVGTYEEIAERLLRDYPVEAGLDPFFATVRPPERLALMLDHLDELPLRRHEIRGNPTGLLARLLRRIDLLKLERISPGALRDWAQDRERAASTAGERERARQELEFAELYARHDAILRDSGCLDDGELVLVAGRLLGSRADVAEDVAARFAHVLVDELEDACGAHLALLAGATPGAASVVASCDPAQAVRRTRGAGEASLGVFRRLHPDAREVTLAAPRRHGGEVTTVVSAVAGEIPGALGVERAAGAGEGVRFWRCAGERAQAQAAAREIEQLLAGGDVPAERVGVVVSSGWREGRLVAAALEERSVPFRFAGDAAFFGRPEVRDVLAWLRMLADPNDAAAVVRALTRPPTELRSGDLARVTTIARRRKLDMVAALEAALESPQLRPEARDRIQGFLKLQRSAANALEAMRADVFVRRLIERIGLRRQRLFAATPEAAERLVNLSRLAELAAEWSQRVPRGSVRDFVRHITAIADAGELGHDDGGAPVAGAVVLAEPEQVKGLEFDHLYLLGLGEGCLGGAPWEDRAIPDELLEEPLPPADDAAVARKRAMLAYVAMSRAAKTLVLSWPDEPDRAAAPAHFYEAARVALGAEEEVHEEEVFGPAEGLHATYRMIRDEVLESSWRAGSALSEMRLDTVEDVTAAVTRYLELIKLAALLQRPGDEPARDVLAALNEALGRVATPEQRAALEASALDQYVLGEERERDARRELVAARREPSLERFIPRRDGGLALSASDLDLYRTCPLKYKFARVFAIPQEPTINQRFGILIHNVLERFHAEELRGTETGAQRAGTLDRLLSLFEAGWRRQGFGSSDDELQYRDRAVAALARYHERHLRAESRPVWLERRFAFAIGPHQLRGRVDRIDQLPGGEYELIDYKTGDRRPAELADDLQLALYRVAAREAWELDATFGSYWYVLSDERVPVPAADDDTERVERTVFEVAAGVEAQDFEPKPSYEICSWCDYRLICPASEA